MRIVSFVPFPKWGYHFGTDLEIIQSHLDIGDDVEVFICNSTLAICDTNASHSFQDCLSCIGIRQAGVRLLSGRPRQRDITSLIVDASKLATLRYEFGSLEDLKEYTFYGFDIGYAVASSLVSLLREPSPDLQAPQPRELLRRLLKASAGIFLGFGDYLDSAAPDRVYVFNTRFANTRAILRACQLRKVDCFSHDRGSAIDKYELYKNVLPHDRREFALALAASWEREAPEVCAEIGERFFIERRRSTEQNWISYTKDQKADMLPEGWDSSKRNIGIFVSSEDEYVAIGKEWEGGVYKSQEEGILRIADAFVDCHQFYFYVRVHPNLKFVNNSQTRRLRSIVGKNLRIIPADSPVSSYSLMDQCEKVVVFGSTMGIEATYSGKPSISCRPTLYSSLNGAYEPGTHAEVVSLIGANLEPKPLNSALIYGYHMKTYGKRFKYFQPKNLFDGTFMDARLRPRGVMRLIIAIIWRLRGLISRSFREKVAKFIILGFAAAQTVRRRALPEQ
jgi:hypothetical protein